MSSIVMADNSETVTITEESDKGNLKENNTELREEINQYFIWTVPSQLPIENNTSFSISVNEAHLKSGAELKISVSGIDENGIIQLHDYLDHSIKGSKVILKNNERIINNNNDILTVNSSSFTETADSNVKTADITMTVEKYRFQLAGNYCNTITFKASIS